MVVEEKVEWLSPLIKLFTMHLVIDTILVTGVVVQKSIE